VNVNNPVTAWTAGLITGLTAGMARFFGAIPNILGALILLIVGWIVAGLVGGLVTKLCRGIHVDTVADRVGVNGFLQQSGTKLRTSNIIGEILKWVIRLVFIEMAAEQLGMPQISLIINQILGFIPNIIVAMVILGVGGFLGQLLGGIVRGAASEAKIGNANLLSRLTFGAVMAFAIIAALNELNVAPVVVNTLYIGLVAALALALGLAFGLGGRDTAARLTERWAAQLETTAKKVQTSQLSPAVPDSARTVDMPPPGSIRTTRSTS
jgi:Conserved TM helix